MIFFSRMSSDSSNGRAISGIRKVFSADPDFFCYLVLFILASLLFLPVIISGKTALIPEYDDFGEWMLYPEFIKQCFRRGYFPLWCDGLYSGLDFVGWGHSSAFYPLNFFFQLFKYAEAATWNQYLHFLIGVCGFFFLARTLKLSRDSSLISTLGYGFTYLIVMMKVNHIPMTIGLVFIPWVCALSLKLIERPKISFFFSLTAILCLELLGGHFELFALQNLYLFLVAGLFYLSDRTEYHTHFRGFLLLLLALFFAGLLSSIMLLPSFTSYAQSYRIMGYTYDYYIASHNPEVYFFVLTGMWAFISPVFFWFFGQGIKKIRIPLYFSFFVISLFFLLNGTNWFLHYSPLYFIPILNNIPARYASLHFTLIFLFIIFGAGIEVYSKNQTSRYFKTVIALSAAEIIFFALLYNYINYVLPNFEAMNEGYRDIKLNYLISRKVILLFLIISFISLMAAIYIFGISRFKNKQILGFYLAVEFIVTGFFVIARHPENIMEFEPGYCDFLATINPREYRIQSVFGFLGYQLKIPKQIGILYNTRAVDADIVFSTLRYSDFLALLDPDAIRYVNDKVQAIAVNHVLKHGDFLKSDNLSLINLVNLKYIIGQDKNIGSPTEYEIAYEDYRFFSRMGVSPGLSHRELRLNPPSSFGLSLYFTPGDKLKIDISCKDNCSRLSILQVMFADNADRSNLIFSTLIEKSCKLSLDLAGLYNKSGKLMFTFSPLGDLSEELSYEASFTIENPNKHFKRRVFKNIDVFENPTALSRAFLVHGAKAIPGKETRLKYLKSRDFDPAQTAVLNNAPFIRFPEKMPMLKDESVNYLEQRSFSGDVKLSAENIAPAILIFSEQYYPGWHAWLDGREAKIVPVDHCFKAVVLAEPGLHSLSLKYAPPSFELGLWVTIATILSWVTFLSMRHIAAAQQLQAATKI